MTKLFSIVAMVFVTMTASAQITWSAKAGLGIATCAGDAEMDNKLVGRLGVGIEKPLTANWSLMPSLEFAMKGAKFAEDTMSENVTLYYLQLPVLAAYRFNLNDSWNMTVKAGPYFAYGVFGDISVGDSSYGVSESVDAFDICNRFDFGIDLAVDFEYHRYVFGLEYEYGLTNLVKKSDGFDVRNAAGYITVGYKF